MEGMLCVLLLHVFMPAVVTHIRIYCYMNDPGELAYSSLGHIHCLMCLR